MQAIWVQIAAQTVILVAAGVDGKEPGLATGLVLLAAGVALVISVWWAAVRFLQWFRLLVRLAHLRELALDETPADATWAFFVPVMNLFRPYGIARKMAGSDATRGMIDAWQWSYIAAGVANGGVNALERASQGESSLVFNVIAVLLNAAAAWCCGRVVRRLTEESDQAFAEPAGSLQKAA